MVTTQRVQFQPMTEHQQGLLEYSRQRFGDSMGMVILQILESYLLPEVLHIQQGTSGVSPAALQVARRAALDLYTRASYINQLYDLQIPGLGLVSPSVQPTPTSQDPFPSVADGDQPAALASVQPPPEDSTRVASDASADFSFDFSNMKTNKEYR